MTIAEKMYEQAKTLPENVQMEALHYLEFLKQKLAEQPSGVTTQPAVRINAHQEKLFDIMKSLSERGTAFQEVDVLAWQKKQREDKVLTFQENA